MKSKIERAFLYTHGGLMLSLFILTSCHSEESLNAPVKDDQIEVKTDLDIYIDDNFTKEFGMAIRYRFSDNYLAVGQTTTPPKLETIRPMLDFIDEFWIEPYLEISNGETFFRDHVPAEIVFFGGLIYQGDGTVVLGTADAGAQITFTNVNAIDPTDVDWRTVQLQTVYHEFAHTVHQLYKLPNAFENITADGYTGPGSWFVLSEEEALGRGFVSPYSTSSPNEDFAETVAFFLFDTNFYDNFIDLEPNCQTDDCVTRNDGRLRIAEKISAIIDHYQKVTGVDLEVLRGAVQSRL